MVKEKLEAMYRERDGLWSAMLLYRRGQQQAVFQYVVVVMGAVGVYWGKDSIPDGLQPWLLLTLSQVGYFLALFIFSLYSMLLVYRVYIARLEKKINELLGEELCFWESGVFKEIMYTPKTSFFTASLIMTLGFITLTAFLMFIVSKTFNFERGYVVLFAIEFISLLLIPLYTLLKEEKVVSGAVSMLELTKRDQ